MPLEPFRFLHAANLFLDHQLQSVGHIPDALRDSLERATLVAWERIVDAAITRRVDFMLLAGNCFDAADQSLTAQVALVEGLQKLDEHDIPVFIVPGESDPDAAWRLGASLPENVTRFGGELGDSLQLSRDGKPFCTLHHVMANIRDLDATDGNGLDELAVFAPQVSGDLSGPFDIALLESITNDSALPPELAESEPTVSQMRSGHSSGTPSHLDPTLVSRCQIEYWALGEQGHRQSWRVGRGMAHSPGSPQGLSPDETGSLGCSLIEVDSDGRVRDSFIPTSLVRYENIATTVHPQSTRDGLMQQLRTAIESLPRTSHEEVWLVTWHISGAGRLLNDLRNPGVCERLWQEAFQSVSGQGLQLHLRRAECVMPADLETGSDFLTQEFVRQLGDWTAEGNLIDRTLAASDLADTPWSPRLKSVLADVDQTEAIRAAQFLGWSWLKNGV